MSTTWLRTETGYWLVRVNRKWCNYPEGKRMVLSEFEWAKKHLMAPNACLIEDKSSSSALLQELGETTVMPLLAVEPVTDKITRIGVESPAIEAGNVWIPEAADWLPDFEREVGSFPASATADQVDSMSQALKHFREGGADAGPRIRSL